jgi:hypothetical protein
MYTDYVNKTINRDYFTKMYIGTFERPDFEANLRDALISSNVYVTQMTKCIIDRYSRTYDVVPHYEDVEHLVRKLRFGKVKLSVVDVISNVIAEFENESVAMYDEIDKEYRQYLDREGDHIEISQDVRDYRAGRLDVDGLRNRIIKSLEFHDVVKAHITKVKANITKRDLFATLAEIIGCIKDGDTIETIRDYIYNRV